MHQSELERAVARATGESRRRIKKHGFYLLKEPDRPPDDVSLALDCPGCGTVVNLTPPAVSALPSLAECLRCDAVYPYREHELYAAPTDELTDSELTTVDCT